MPTLHTPVHWEGSTVCMLFDGWAMGVCSVFGGFFAFSGGILWFWRFFIDPWYVAMSGMGAGCSRVVCMVCRFFPVVLIFILLECALLLTYSKAAWGGRNSGVAFGDSVCGDWGFWSGW